MFSAEVVPPWLIITIVLLIVAAVGAVVGIFLYYRYQMKRLVAKYRLLVSYPNQRHGSVQPVNKY